jgi:hypothetical protein
MVMNRMKKFVYFSYKGNLDLRSSKLAIRISNQIQYRTDSSKNKQKPMVSSI